MKWLGALLGVVFTVSAVQAQQVINLPPGGITVIPPPGTASITIAPQVSPSPTPTATPTPTPTATPSTGPTPSPISMLPRGIYYLGDYDTAVPSSPLALAYVDGATIRVRWKTLEPSEGSFSWATLDSSLATIAAAGKQAQILLGAGHLTPPWVMAAGAKVYPPDGTPLPWDPIYQAKLKDFINALAAHLTSTGKMSIIAGVVATGIAESTAETKLCATGSACITDTAGWTAAGYSRDKVKQAFTTILGYWANAFPTAGLSSRYLFDAFPQGFMPSGCSGTDNLYPRELSALANNAYPGRYVFGYNGLDNTTAISGGAGPGNLLPQMCPLQRAPGNLWQDCEDPNASCTAGQDWAGPEGLQENGPETNTFADEWTLAQANLTHLTFIEVYPQGFTSANAAGLISAHNALTGGAVPSPTPSPTPTSTPSTSPTPTPTPTPTVTPTSTPTTTPTVTPSPSPTSTPTPVAGGPISNIVAVWMENETFSAVFPSGCTPPNCTSSSMPNLANLVNHPPSGIGSALAEGYAANAHPSACNYLSAWSGRQDGALGQGCSLTGSCGNCSDGVAGCFGSFPAGPWNGNVAHARITEDDISNELRTHGKTVKTYAEDFSSVTTCGGTSGLYAARHNPAINFSDVVANPNSVVNFSQFASDVAANRLPQFANIIPNTCSDGHDGGTACGLNHADAWLKTNVIDKLFGPGGPPEFQPGGKGVLVVTFDEGVGDFPSTNHPAPPEIAGGGVVVFTLSGPSVKNGFTNKTLYQHPAFARMILEGLGVTTFPGDAGSANSIVTGGFF